MHFIIRSDPYHKYNRSPLLTKIFQVKGQKQKQIKETKYYDCISQTNNFAIAFIILKSHLFVKINTKVV